MINIHYSYMQARLALNPKPYHLYSPELPGSTVVYLHYLN